VLQVRQGAGGKLRVVKGYEAEGIVVKGIQTDEESHQTAYAEVRLVLYTSPCMLLTTGPSFDHNAHSYAASCRV
jgi:hypothetical protein